MMLYLSSAPLMYILFTTVRMPCEWQQNNRRINLFYWTLPWHHSFTHLNVNLRDVLYSFTVLEGDIVVSSNNVEKEED